MDIEGRPDSVDWELLTALQENARLSYTELGRRVGLTPPAVAERIRRLEESGVIEGYRLELNLSKVGRSLQAIIRIATNDIRGCNLGVELTEMPEVLQCDRITGEDCYSLKIAVSSPQHLERFIDRLAAYGRTTTCVVLSSPITHRVVEPLNAAEPVQQNGAIRQNSPVRAIG